MTGDSDRNFDEHPPEDESPEPAASVIFTELMRRAAATRQPEADDTVDDGAPIEAESPQPTKSPEELRREAAMEAQRVRRVQRRRQRRRQQTVGIFGGITRSLLVIILSGVLMATILSLWTDPEALTPELRANLRSVDSTSESAAGVVLVPTNRPTPNWMRRIGIISGHSGVFIGPTGPTNDPGAVCYGPGGEVLLTEQDINFAVAERVVNGLRQLGYTVDLLEEFDTRLEGYQAAALVSIHANDCSEYRNVDGSLASAFLVSQAQDRMEGGQDTVLRECLANEYQALTELERRFSLTRDMTDYHIFRSIDIRTPGVIIEMGFMLGDQDLLVNQPDLLAQGIINGVLCFLQGETPQPDQVAAQDTAVMPTPTP